MCDWRKENHSGRLCPLFKQKRSGGRKRRRKVEKGMRGRKTLTAAQPEAPQIRGSFLPPRHQQPLDYHYFTSRRAHMHVHAFNATPCSTLTQHLQTAARRRGGTEILREATWLAIRRENLANADRSRTSTSMRQRVVPIEHRRAHMTYDSCACRARGPCLRWSSV